MAAVVQPMQMIRTSSNIATYTERGRTGTGEYVWAEVIRSDCKRTSGGIVIDRRIPVFDIRVHQNMRGQVATITYEPKTRPPRKLLAARTVTGLVRARLAQLQRGEG